jgi:hypothetical protein
LIHSAWKRFVLIVQPLQFHDSLGKRRASFEDHLVCSDRSPFKKPVSFGFCKSLITGAGLGQRLGPKL